jgi:hypothetical protein
MQHLPSGAAELRSVRGQGQSIVILQVSSGGRTYFTVALPSFGAIAWPVRDAPLWSLDASLPDTIGGGCRPPGDSR